VDGRREGFLVGAFFDGLNVGFLEGRFVGFAVAVAAILIIISRARTVMLSIAESEYEPNASVNLAGARYCVSVGMLKTSSHHPTTTYQQLPCLYPSCEHVSDIRHTSRIYSGYICISPNVPVRTNFI
jgi:hypothetical protein